MDIIMTRIIDLLEQRNYKHITCELWGDEGGIPVVVVDHTLEKNSSDDISEVEDVVQWLQDDVKVNVKLDFGDKEVEIDYIPMVLEYYVGATDKESDRCRYIIIKPYEKSGKSGAVVKLKLNGKITRRNKVSMREAKNLMDMTWSKGLNGEFGWDNDDCADVS